MVTCVVMSSLWRMPDPFDLPKFDVEIPGIRLGRVVRGTQLASTARNMICRRQMTPSILSH